MKLGQIEVSGITRIVINRETVWERFDEVLIGREPLWVKRNGDEWVCTHLQDEVKRMLDHFINNKQYRIWVHGETINIVRRDLE